MYHIIPMCCACLSTKTLTKLPQNDIHLLDRLIAHPLDFEHLKFDIPLYICHKCNNFLNQIREFQCRFTKSTNTMKGYVRQLKMGNNFVLTTFTDVTIPLSTNAEIKKLKNELIVAKQPVVRLERSLEAESALKLCEIDCEVIEQETIIDDDVYIDCEEVIEQETIIDDDVYIDTTEILDIKCVIDEPASENCSLYEYNSSENSDNDETDSATTEYFNTGIRRTEPIPPRSELIKDIRNKLSSILKKKIQQMKDRNVSSEDIKKEIIEIEENNISDVKIKEEFDIVNIKDEIV